MRIEVQRVDLSRILSAIAKVVEPRNAVPVLSNVVLTAADGTLTARGTDLDIEITATCSYAGEGGVACVPARQLTDIVKRMVGETVSLEFILGAAEDTGDVIVKSGRSRFKLPSVPSRFFPTLATKEYSHHFTVDLGKLFAPVMSSVLAESAAKPELCGVYLHEHDGRLTAASADGPRITVYGEALPDGADGLAGVIVPTKVANLAIGLRAAVDVSVGRNRIRFAAPGIDICAKLIEGDYPNYRRAIPTSHERTLRIGKADLLAAAGRVGVVAAEAQGKAIRLNIAPGSIELVARDKDGREAVDEIAVQYDGEPTWVAYNVGFLDDMLNAAPGAEVEFDITDNTVPTRVRSVSDAGFVGVISPFRMAA